MRQHHQIRNWALCSLLILCVGLPLTSVAADQDEEAKGTDSYTRVALWEVDRDNWSDFKDEFEKYDQPILEKLFADGTITEWGLDANALHKPDGYTHSTWYSASSMSALAKAGEAYNQAWEDLGDEVDSSFNDMVGRHRDFIIQTEGMRAKAVTIDGGYFVGHEVIVTRGKYRQFMSYWNNRIKPVYEQLLADGAIVAYGLSEEEVTTGNPMSTDWWYVMADADGFDAVKAAFEASWEDMDDEGRRARWLSVMDVVEEDSFSEWITHIIHMQVAEH